MNPISASEVRTGDAYEAVRLSARDRLAASQRERRVQLGDDLAVVFESRDTAIAALEEALRAERRTDEEAVDAALTAFNALLAPAGQLAATLYVDIADPAALADRIRALPGLAAAVHLEVAGARVPARTVAEDDLEVGALSLVFGLDEDLRRSWPGADRVAIVVDHPSAHLRVELSTDTATSIGALLTT